MPIQPAADGWDEFKEVVDLEPQPQVGIMVAPTNPREKQGASSIAANWPATDEWAWNGSAMENTVKYISI